MSLSHVYANFAIEKVLIKKIFILDFKIMLKIFLFCSKLKYLLVEIIFLPTKLFFILIFFFLQKLSLKLGIALYLS